MRPLGRLLRLAVPARPRTGLAVALAAGSLAGGVALTATAAYLVGRSAVVTSFVEIQVALAAVRAFALSRGGLRYLERLVSHDLSFRVLARVRAWFYEAIEPLAPAVLLRHRAGEVLGLVVADVEALEELSARAVVPAAAAVLVSLAACLLLAAIDARLGVELLLGLALAGAALPLLTRAAGRRDAVEEAAARAELRAALVDLVQGAPELLALGQEERQRARVAALSERLRRGQDRLGAADGLASAISGLLTTLTAVAALVTAIPLVATGHLAGAALAVVPLAALASFEAVQPLPAAQQHLERGRAAAARLFALTDAQPAVRDPDPPARRPAGAGIEVRGLRFAYGPDEPAVLDGVSLSVPPGGRLGIAGPSGAGKTTLLNLLLRFWDYAEGEVRVGGRELRECRAEDVRAMIAVVAQGTHLFGGSVRTNLLLARPGADQAALEAAARAARLHDVVERLPRGYDTWIGENGHLLSGGERQRLAIARAILKDAPILVLDEATAHLDAGTEAEVLEALRDLLRGRTAIIVDHRPAVLALADRVLELRGGRLV